MGYYYSQCISLRCQYLVGRGQPENSQNTIFCNLVSFTAGIHNIKYCATVYSILKTSLLHWVLIRTYWLGFSAISIWLGSWSRWSASVYCFLESSSPLVCPPRPPGEIVWLDNENGPKYTKMQEKGEVTHFISWLIWTVTCMCPVKV